MMRGLLSWVITLGAVLLSMLLAPATGNTAHDIRPAVEATTELEGSACTPSDSGARSIRASTAIGLIVFNSPYIFGAKALRDGLTCNACHSPGGPSGAAKSLESKGIHPPSLRVAQERGIDLILFARKAVSEEFAGPLLNPLYAEGLAELAGRLQATERTGQDACVIGPLGLVQLAVEIVEAQSLHLAPSERDFMIESARFILGEIDRGARSEAAIAPSERAFENVVLKEIERLPRQEGHVLAQTVLARLHGILVAAGVAPISIASE
jgi:hypothetical protein